MDKNQNSFLEIFPSFIWRSKLYYSNKNNFIKTIEENYDISPNNTPKGWACSVHTSFKDQKIIPRDLIDTIVKKIYEFIDENEYVFMLKDRKQYYISDIWHNVYTGNHFQEIHTHGSALFSGVYYLKIDKELHHSTFFYNSNYNVNYKNIGDNQYFGKEIECEEDDVIIFPGYFKHSTNGCKIKKINRKNFRITISFNVNYDSLDKLETSKIINYF